MFDVCPEGSIWLSLGSVCREGSNALLVGLTGRVCRGEGAAD